MAKFFPTLTFSNTTSATLNDNTNIGFTPEKTFLAEANDKVIIESFDSLNTAAVTISDPSVKDSDVLTISLSDKNTPIFNVVKMDKIETLHIDVSGAATGMGFSGDIKGLSTLELAGASTKAFTVNNNFSDGIRTYQLPKGLSKIDASAMTSYVDLNAMGSDVTNLVGSNSSIGDILTIGEGGGTMTGNAGPDTFKVGGVQNNKLVTITDISTGDRVDFGTNVTLATELKVTGSADETTFIKELQKAADVAGGSHTLYYGIYNGNTYVVDTGATAAGSTSYTLDELKKMILEDSTGAGTAKLAVTPTKGAISDGGSPTAKFYTVAATPVDSTAAATITVTNGSIANATAISFNGVELSANTADAAESFEGNFVGATGTAISLAGPSVGTDTLKTLSAEVATTSIKGTVSGGTMSNYSSSSDPATADVGSATATFNPLTVNDLTNIKYNNVAVPETGITVANTGVDGTSDDIIVKLTGSHTLETATSVAGSELVFA